jgi:HEAT repeat protein
LAALGGRACLALACWNDLPTVTARRAALRALGGTKDARAATVVPLGFADTDRMVRLSAMLAAAELIPTIAKPEADALAAALEKARAEETDPLVRRLVDPSPKK